MSHLPLVYLLPPAQLIQRLLDAGWTQLQIAEHTGTTQPTISRVRDGVITHPDYAFVDKLRSVCLSVDALSKGEAA